MKKKIVVQICLLCTVFATAQTVKLTDYVDPSIGIVLSRGNTFIGPALPSGMAKVGPDCGDKGTNSGYRQNEEVCGFSHTHTNGTGGGPKYGNILMMAGTGALNLLKYSTFPESADAWLLLDLGSFLGWNNIMPDERQYLVGSEVEILNNREICGYSRVRGGGNRGDAYTVYFYAIFDTPATGMGTWKNEKTDESLSQFDTGLPTGTFFRFKTKNGQQIKVKVGISFISTGKAKANLLREMDHWDFDNIVNEAVDTWEKILSKVRIEGGSETNKKIFYSSLYRIFSQPINKTGENPKWKSDEPYYDDFYAIWDTYRATHPFLTLVNANRQVEIVRALIDIYRYEGYMPDGRIGNGNGRTQGGSNGDVLIADALSKNLNGIDYETAFASMIKNAEVPPGDDEQKQGRGGIADYNQLGYVSIRYERSGSRTVEYAYNDFCLALVAKKPGKEDAIADKYFRRSENWKNLWRPIESDGFKGFVMLRLPDGRWWDEPEGAPFTPHSGGSWNHVFYESKSWEYSLYVPHDVAGLIEKCGGKETFTARLDTFFGKDFFQRWNEPGFLTPCLYNYVGVQHRTAALVRRLLALHYKDTRDGVPGDDDSGSMSAWYCFHNGKVFTVVAKNNSAENKYIQSATLNGRPLHKPWFTHRDITDGDILTLVMGNEPAKQWGNRAEDAPPSDLDYINQKK
jgi:predicted alpha-1,2-mannosidase